MADQNTNIIYSVADIQRYQQGTMSAKEMHDMERAALQDPFLADAIEGFAEAPFEQSNKHLNEITALLQSAKEDAKIVVMPAKNFQWLRVAAMFILIAGAGTLSWYVFSLNNTAGEKNIAQVTVAQEDKADTVVQPAMLDTTTVIAQNNTAEKRDVADNRYKRKEVVIAPSLNNGDLAAAPQVSDNADRKSPDVIIKKEEAETLAGTASAPVVLRPQAYAKDTVQSIADAAYFNKNKFTVNEFKGRVIDINNQPVANAVVSAGNQRATYTDGAGNFTLKSPDTLLNVTVSSVGFLSAQTALKKNAYNNIAVQPNSESLSDVVVTGYSTKKKESKKLNNADSAFPSGGWQSFQQYVHKQLGQPLDSLGEYEETNGVEVEFTIDKNGVPYNFKVTGPQTDELNSKAIDIIKHGPKWITTRKNKKAKVVIPF